MEGNGIWQLHHENSLECVNNDQRMVDNLDEPIVSEIHF